MARQSLESWLAEVMTDGDKTSGPCAAISLHHVDQGGNRGVEIHSVRFGNRAWKEGDLAELFRHKASSFVQDLDGVQTFVLCAYYGKSKEPEAVHPFRLKSEDNGMGAFKLMTEPPNETGVRQQQMRLTEALVQGAYRQNALLMDNVLRINEMLARHNSRLQEEQQTMTETMRTMILTQVTHNHEQKMKEVQAQERAVLIERATELAPAFLNSLTGRKVVPDATADTALIRGLASALKDERAVQALASVLPAEVMGPLAQRLAEVLQGKEKAKEEAKRRLQLVSPEDDVQGGRLKEKNDG